MSDKIRFLSQKEIKGLELHETSEVFCLPHLDECTHWYHLTVEKFLEIFPACAGDMVEGSFSRRLAPTTCYVGMLTQDFILVWDRHAVLNFFCKAPPLYADWSLIQFKWCPITMGGSNEGS